MTVTVYAQATNRRLLLVKTAQPVSRIGPDGWVSFHAPLPRATARVYIVNIEAGDIHGNKIERSLVLRVKARHK
jgi:hypothetical protein